MPNPSQLQREREPLQRAGKPPKRKCFVDFDEYTPDEIEFMNAMDQYKRDNRRFYPTWSEVLEVLRSLGYRKVD